MAASYSTGVSSSPTNLIQTLVTWLQAQGWAVNFSEQAPDEPGWEAHLNKGGIYVHMRAAEDERIWVRTINDPPPHVYYDRGQGWGIGLYLSDDYDNELRWYEQGARPLRVDTLPDSSLGCGLNLPSGPVAAYHFFDDGNDHITVVVEKTPGLFVHMGWGPSLVKTGYSSDYWHFYASTSFYNNTYKLGEDEPGVSFTAAAPMAHSVKANLSSGQYCLPVSFVRVDAAVFTPRWLSSAALNSYLYGYTGRYLRHSLNQSGTTSASLAIGKFPNYEHFQDQDRAHQTAFTGALLLPLHCFCERLTARYSPIGYPPTVFFCSAVGHGWAPGEVYQVGGLDYMVFPNFAVRKAA